MLTDTDFAILNAIYLKKMAPEPVISSVIGLPGDKVGLRLAAADDEGWIMNLPEGAMLLPEGTQQVLDYYQNTYADVRGDPATLAWYEHFETLNSRFIAAVTEWQRTEGDERVERKLLQIAEKLSRDIGQLQPKVPRYSAYVRRFEQSMDLVDQGRREFVCKPTLDSVHNIWFEFHEDILAVLGRPRDTT
jgi:hypothetical protein